MDLSCFGEQIEDPEEESFLAFSQPIPSQNLGIIDSNAPVLELDIAGRHLNIQQSPRLLTSNRSEGTTGAVVWKITPLFASWMESPTNPLFTGSLLNASSTVIELGAGVSGIVALTLAPKISRYIATDLNYVLKFLRQNITENSPSSAHHQSHQKRTGRTKRNEPAKSDATNITILELDWETTQSSSILPNNGVDALIACDCIYNEALITPFVTACADICALRSGGPPTICVIAQQLRAPDVFETWLKTFWKLFTVWTVPDSLLPDGLKEGTGFIVHVGVLRSLKEAQE